jgi:betaine-homocysteine S-methyltransferase
LTPEEACRRLKDAGADVVGLNCVRGPRILLLLIEAIRARWRGPIAALPAPDRTREDQPSFQSLRDPGYRDLPDGRPFPTALDPFTCNPLRDRRLRPRGARARG